MTRKKVVPFVKPMVTWILVADGRHAQIYKRQNVERIMPVAGNSRLEIHEVCEPVPVPGMKWKAESAGKYQIGRDAGGVVYESVGGARHMSEPHVTVQEEIRMHFAKTIADQLDRARTDRHFDRLILIAPAKMLGEIKKHASRKVLKSITIEMPKDFTHQEAHELAEHLEGIA